MRGKIVGDRYYLEGEEVTREAFFAAFPPPSNSGGTDGLIAWKRPLLSNAMAVHPNQVKAATERNKRHGVNVTYLPDGTAVIPDRSARRDLLKLEGAHDRSGGYGDDPSGSRVSRLPDLPPDSGLGIE